MRRLILTFFIAGCSGSTTVDSGIPDAGPHDAGIPDAGSTGNLPDGGFSACGLPGDMSNDAGIGKYCLSTADCPANASLCTDFQNMFQPANMQSFFCTNPCDCANPNTCGDNATCVCQGPGACGCVPNRCAALFPDGGLCDGGT